MLFEKYSVPLGIAFAPDGKTMLVSVSRGSHDTFKGEGWQGLQDGAIVRVSPEGKVVGEVAEGLERPTGMAFAPEGFGAYGGQLFVADAGKIQLPAPLTQPLYDDGKIYRITPDGKPVLVASGLINPIVIRFIGKKLWITDINADFIGGKRELPDGFIVTMEAK